MKIPMALRGRRSFLEMSTLLERLTKMRDLSGLISEIMCGYLAARSYSRCKGMDCAECAFGNADQFEKWIEENETAKTQQ